MVTTFFVRTAFIIIVIAIGYSQALYEGSICTLYDGSKGVCKNVGQCESIKEGIKQRTLKLEHIVGCSFVGTTQIACCADERPLPGRNRPSQPDPSNNDFVFINWPSDRTSGLSDLSRNIIDHRAPSLFPSISHTMNGQLTNFVFPSDTRRTTSTHRPIKTTTENWRGHEWSNPVDRKDNRDDSHFPGRSPNRAKILHENPPQTTTETPSWLREIANEYTTTTKTTTTATNKDDLLPWMQNFLDEYSTSSSSNRNQPIIQTTTSKTIKTTTINSFWSEWSATKPSDINDNQIESDLNSTQETGQNEKLREATTEVPRRIGETSTVKTDTAPWILETVNENYIKNNKDNDLFTFATDQKVHVVTELPSWMQEVLHGYSSTTTRNDLISFHFENGTKKSTNVGDDGGGGGILSIGGGNGDLHLSPQNSNDNDSSTFNRQQPGHVTSPSDSQTKLRYDRGSKAEAACEIYSALEVDDSLTWKILGGVSANLGEYPWMAALGFGDSSKGLSFDCGGTIISDYFILTAAHCTPARRPPQIVRLGKVTLHTNDDNADPTDLNIEDIIRHPNYKSATKKNDIALIRVANRISFNEYIRPACLQTDLNDIRPETELFITGWGTVSAERTIRPSVLLKTNVTSMPLQQCNTTLYEYNLQSNQASLRNGLSESQCCAYDPAAKNDACQGDSGGPLQTPVTSTISKIVGIVSFGISCGTALPSVYTRVAYYLDWIEPIVWPNSV